MNILCKIGLHSWKHYDSDLIGHKHIKEYRICSRCYIKDYIYKHENEKTTHIRRNADPSDIRDIKLAKLMKK